uniref:Uncharacterized protein n=1 Tax=Setaria digitata TaxID=48799 RepID=A0A915PY97_9BILA
MGPLGSKHAEHEGQSDAISGKRRSRKNHKKYSPLRMQRDKNLRPSHLDHQKPNGELTISKKGRSKKQRKKWHKEKKTLIEKGIHRFEVNFS